VGLVEYDAVALECNPSTKENLELRRSSHFLAGILPRFSSTFLGSPRRIVDKLIRCHCGFEARAENEDGLVAEVQRHASEAHGMALSHDEALLLSFRAELDATATSRKPVREVVPDPSQGSRSDVKEEQ
jgi:hypothetical protein